MAFSIEQIQDITKYLYYYDNDEDYDKNKTIITCCA